MTLPADLVNIRNHLYRRVQYWWLISLAISVGVLALALLGLWFATRRLIGLGGLFALLAPAAIAWAREAASLNFLRADKCRRVMLYGDGLGHPVSAEDLAQIRAWALGSRIKDAGFVKPYYSSTKPIGPQRLADIVAESAFFTEFLSGKMAGALWVSFVLVLVGAALALYAADFTSERAEHVVLLLAKSAAVLVSFLLAGDVLLLAKKYGDLRREAHHAFLRCAQLREEPGLSVDIVRTVVEDYGMALLQAPPILTFVYSLYRDELNRIYRVSHTT